MIESPENREGPEMKKERLTAEQIVGILQEPDRGEIAIGVL